MVNIEEFRAIEGGVGGRRWRVPKWRMQESRSEHAQGTAVNGDWQHPRPARTTVNLERSSPFLHTLFNSRVKRE